MSERRDEQIRGLLEQLDARVREAERLRRQIAERQQHGPFWPDRRRVGRIADDEPQSLDKR
jgi:hypothetical protein